MAKKKYKFDFRIEPEKCYSCGTCEDVCPTDSIYIDDTPQYAIDQSTCNHCSMCYRACPIDAVTRIKN